LKMPHMVRAPKIGLEIKKAQFLTNKMQVRQIKVPALVLGKLVLGETSLD